MVTEENLEDFGSNIPVGYGKDSQKALAVEEPPYPEDHEEFKIKLDRWSIVGPQQFASSSVTIEKLPPAMYQLSHRNGRIVFEKQTTCTDDLIRFPDSTIDDVIQEVEKFWDVKTENKFKKYGYSHRRGLLLYGAPGGGKSCIIQLIVEDIIKRNGLVILCNVNPSMTQRALSELRQIQPDTPIVCIFEDIDALIRNYGEDDFLSLLDGETQINKVLNIATTNYPEMLDKRIVARPRRFDRRIKVSMPNEKIRALYFDKKLKIDKEELNKWVTATNDFSFAAMAELVICVKCLDNAFDDSVEKLKKLMSNKISSSDFETSRVGFSSNKGSF